MATNRYSSITPSQFSPLSLQEIMLVPTLKRQHHDASLEGMEQFRSNLLKADPHRKYQEEALRIQNEMNSEIDSEIERLNQEGFNPSTRANLSRLNRKVNDLLAPTGRLGQINAHKIALNEAYKNYLEESIKAGNSPEIAKYHAEQALAKHMQDPLYDEQGNVISFNIGAAPTFVDFDKFAFDAAKMAGMDERYWANASSYLDYDKDNNRYVVNESAKGLNANNYAGLQAAVTYINNTLKDETSPLRRSVDYNLRNIDNLSILGNNIIDIHRSSKSGITDRSSSKSNVDWSEREVEEPEVYSHSSETMPWSDNYQDALGEIEKVLNNPESTPADIKDARQKQEVLNEINKDEQVQKLTEEENSFLESLSINPGTVKYLKSGQIDLEQPLVVNNRYEEEINGKKVNRSEIIDLKTKKRYIINEEDEHKIEQFRQFKLKQNEKINERKSALLSTKGKEQTSFLRPMKISDRNNYTSNLKLALNSNNVKATDIYVTDSDGKQYRLKDKFGVLADNDSRAILDMLRSVPNEKIQAVPTQRGSQIGMEITFIPNDGTSVDPKGWGFNSNKVKFDGNKPVQMFIPITKNIDGRTGLDESSKFAFSILPENMQREITEKIHTADLSTTSDVTQLGKSKVPASRFLIGFDDKYLDFSYMNYDGTMNKKDNVKQGHVPHIIDKHGNSKSLNWSDVIDTDRLNDSNYLLFLEQSGVMPLIQQQYQNGKGAYKSVEDILKNSPIILPSTDNFTVISLLSEIKN